ncbi:DUF881 domain-containing protein [Alkaliphilus peptidifermentans]|uniref:Uncharacterized conserved protein YlxW, UPF0749 family n=1 Tax=Alkaliphilus peptidifermentans DSM 18978 TaxID=1120976 RepID=A0A1G5BDZ0_9FIRM|nr:DUF881 domain-containing protein [Alkaliphilus peptidifermentans]SCX88270.1 Uncharacterized conserved protein YlxW, UPF0749 family [Alkaliphilus peptidifermentans DSM 18978]
MINRYDTLKILIIFVIFGFFLTFQIRNIEEDYSFVSLKTMSDLQDQVNRELEDIKNFRELVIEKENRLNEYKKALSEDGSIRDVLRSELDSVKMISGYTDLQGPGIIVKLSDSERELYEGENPNDLIIHRTDVLMIINDLKIAGAEAISINGQRIIHASEVLCSGATITINNHVYGQPFIIVAIGDPITLDAAIKSADSYGSHLRDFFGIKVESQTSPRVRISKYNGDFAMKFAAPREGE